MTMDAAEALARVPLLAGLEKKELARLARSFRERTYAEADVVTREGETGTGFFVIIEGSANVLIGGTMISTLHAGDFFGEMALIDEGPRSATIVAATALSCIGLTPWEFRPFVLEHPTVAWTMLQTLARRLRAIEA